MGNSNDVEIKINSSQYWPNSNIKGLVVIHNAENTLKNIKNLYLHFQGYESGEDIRSNRSICSLMNLLKEISNEELIQKTIIIPFTYRIPNYVYSSLEQEKYGIRYTLTLISESIKGWTEDMIKIPITIVERANQSNNKRIITRNHQMSGYLFTDQGHMRVECELQGDEFYIGDTINLKILFDLRQSKQYVEDIFIQLVEKTIFTQPHVKFHEKIIQEQELPGLFQGTIQELSIPFLLFNMKDVFHPSTNGQNIKLDYIIRLKTYTTKFNVNNNDLCVDIPIKICRPVIDSDKFPLKHPQFADLYREYSVINISKDSQSSYSDGIYYNFYKQKMYDRSLLTVDILGAQPKSRHNYMNRLLPNQLSFDEQQRLQQINCQQIDNKFLKWIISLEEGDISMISIISLIFVFLRVRITFQNPRKSTLRFRRMKYSNIGLQKIITMFQSMHIHLQGQIDVDRLLCTNDIDGAVQGTLMSKAVKNQEIAQKLRSNREEIKIQQNKALQNSQVEETFVQQQYEDTSPPQRKKSYSVQTSPAQNLDKPKYEYMNRPLKLPPITERISAVINPISNKLQLRQNNRNYLLEDYEKTLKLLQKQPPLRLFV